MAAVLGASPDKTPVAVSGYFIEDADPIIFAETFNRADVPARWFDAREALIAAANAGVQRLAVPAYTPLAAELQARFLNHVEPIAQTRNFKVYPFDVESFRAQIATWSCAACPARFDDQVELIGLDYPVQISQTDGALLILSAWRVLRESQPASTAIFVHLLDAKGQVAAQDDRLGVPRHTWQPGDEFVQLHHLSIDQLPPGKYTLELGLYDRADGRRWAAQDRSGQAIGDHVILGEIEVTP